MVSSLFRLARPLSLVVPAAALVSSIFTHTKTLLAGDVLAMQGDLTASALPYVLGVSSGVPTLLPIIQDAAGNLCQAAGGLQAQFSATAPVDLYKAWVVDNGVSSAPVYINRAWLQFFDSPEVVAGGTVRVIGRRLRFTAAGTPTVRWVPRDTKQPTVAGTIASFAHEAKTASTVATLNVPATLVAGVLYDVYYSNGLGGGLGEVMADQPLLVIPTGTNPYGLRVGWGHRFTSQATVDLTTDSRLDVRIGSDRTLDYGPTLRQAISLLGAAGGTVLLPAGVVRMNKLPYESPCIKGANNVVLRGQGLASTTLQYGYDGTSEGTGFDMVNVSLFGWMDMTIENVNTNRKWVSNVYAGEPNRGYSVKNSYLFVKNVAWKMNHSIRLNFNDTDCLYFENFTVNQTNIFELLRQTGTVRCDGSKHVSFYGCQSLFETGVITFNNTFRGGCENVVFEDCLTQRDGRATWTNSQDTTPGDYSSQLVNHLTSWEFTRNVAMLNSTFQLLYPEQAKHINDGEPIVAEQGANYQPDAEVGYVTGATATTLTDGAKAWNTIYDATGTTFQQPGVAFIVEIVAGKGWGQRRTIASRKGSTLALATAWDVLPDATSGYAIYVWGSENWLISGCKLLDNQRGPTIYYNAAHDILINKTDLVDSGSIDFTPKVLNSSDNSKTTGLLPQHENQVYECTASDTKGRMGTFIGIHPNYYINNKAFGTVGIGNEFWHNTINSLSPNTPAKVDADFDNGYLAEVFFQIYNLGPYDDSAGIPALFNTTFVGNTAKNCNHAYSVSTGTYNTVIKGATLSGIPAANLLNNKVLNGQSVRASVKTVVL